MSDDPLSRVDLTLILRNTERASRDAAAAFEAVERLVTGIGPRFDAIEARLTSLEQRMTTVERGIDNIARSNHRLEQLLTDIAAKLS